MTARMIVILAALIGGLYALDTFLARVERSEIAQEAGRHYRAGLDLYARRQPADAVEEFRRAWSLERTNVSYQLELAAAELESGNLDDAHDLLDDALRRDPNSGRANLLQARLLKHEGRPVDSDAYYHRAIYGIWPSDGGGRRIQTRLELIRELDRRRDRKQLLAELLPLEADAQNEKEDPTLLAGLGEAQLAAGHYISALNSFQHAYRLDPARNSTQQDMQLAASLVALDPTPRRLPSRDKFERSSRILRMVSEGCPGNPDLLRQADDLLADHTDRTNEAAEQRLQLAGQLWQHCSATKSRLLPILMHNLAVSDTPGNTSPY